MTTQKKFFQPGQHRIGPDEERCRDLFVAVMKQAIREASGIVSPDAGGKPTTQRQIKDQAIAWFGSKDFYEVCSYIGLDGDVVLERFNSGKIDAKQLKLNIESDM